MKPQMHKVLPKRTICKSIKKGTIRTKRLMRKNLQELLGSRLPVKYKAELDQLAKNPRKNGWIHLDAKHLGELVKNGQQVIGYKIHYLNDLGQIRKTRDFDSNGRKKAKNL